MKKILSCVLTFILCITFNCSCKRNNNIVVYRNYYDQDVTTFNYMLTNKYQDIVQIANLVDGLVENDIYGNIVPSIAKSWKSDIVNDKQIWTFYLKNDVYWSDYKGNKYSLVTANDFVTTIKYTLNYSIKSDNYNLAAHLLENGLNYYYGTLMENHNYETILSKISSLQLNDPNNELDYYLDIKSVFDFCNASNSCTDNFDLVGIKAIDDFTLEFTLTNPIPYFLSSLTYYAFLPVSETFLKEVGFNNFGTSKKTLLYNGAYLLSDYTHSSKIEYSKNPNYWDKENVFIDKLVFTKLMSYHSSSFTRLAYENGNVDEFVVNKSDDTGWNKYVLVNNGSDNNPGANNTYVSNETNNFTVYHMLFNQNRSSYNLSMLSQEENIIANRALSNLNFRKSLTYGINRGYYFNNEISTLESSLIPSGFIQHQNKDYTDYFIEEYSKNNNLTYEQGKHLFNNDPYYDLDKSSHYLDLAINELNLESNNLPIKIEYSYYYDESYKIIDKDRITKWNRELNGCAADDINCKLDKIQIVYNDKIDSVSDYYIAMKNKEYHLTFIGLYPDYNDPMTFLSAFSSNGELSSYINYNNDESIDAFINEISNYYEDDELIDRFKACAKLEYYIILEKNLVLPLALKNSSKQIVVSNIVPFSKMKASYGLSPFKFKYRKMRNKDYSQTEIAKLKKEYEEGNN